LFVLVKALTSAPICIANPAQLPISKYPLGEATAHIVAKKPLLDRLIMSVYPAPLLSKDQNNEPPVVAPDFGLTAVLKFIEFEAEEVVFHALPVLMSDGEYWTVIARVAGVEFINISAGVDVVAIQFLSIVNAQLTIVCGVAWSKRKAPEREVK